MTTAAVITAETWHTSLHCAHIHGLFSKFSKCQWMSMATIFFCTTEFNAISLLHIHFCVRTHFVRLPLWHVPIEWNGILVREFNLYCCSTISVLGQQNKIEALLFKQLSCLASLFQSLSSTPSLLWALGQLPRIWHSHLLVSELGFLYVWQRAVINMAFPDPNFSSNPKCAIVIHYILIATRQPHSSCANHIFSCKIQ